MRKRDLQQICRDLRYRPDLGKHESTEQVVYGLALLASLGRQAEAQLLQLKEKGHADRPLVWVESNEVLDHFQIRTSVIAQRWDLTRESYPEFGKLKARVIGPKLESDVGDSVRVSTGVFLLGTGLVFNVKKGRVERRVLSDKVLDVEIRIDKNKTTTWSKPVDPMSCHVTYWIGGSGHGTLLGERWEVDLKSLRNCVSRTMIGQTRCGNLAGEMPQVGRARDIVMEWLEKDQVCEQWVPAILGCRRAALDMASEVMYAKESIPLVMES